MSVDLAVETPLAGNAQYVRDQNGNRSSLSLSREGNIGVGTERPEARLEVSADASGPWFRLGRGGDAGRVWVEYGEQYAPLLVLSDQDDPPRIQFQQTGSRSEGSPEFASWIGMVPRSANLAIIGGRVGIGTLDPATRLEVNGGLTVGHEGDNAFIDFKAANQKTGRIGVQDDSDQGFFVHLNGAYRFSVNQNGNVGIGTDYAETKLEIAGGMTVGHDGDNSYINFKANNGRMGSIGVQDDNEQGFYVHMRGEYRLSINQNGNVGIGTTNPGAKLEVNGTIRAKGLDLTGPLTLPGQELIIADLTTPPATAYTTDLVIDKVTGRIYRQS
jgi:hypothetical protein